MTIKRYNPQQTIRENTFFIQSHGLHAGRPLRKPIPNSWQLDTKTKYAFEICYMIYNSKFLKNYIRGSVIPFLTLNEYKKILLPIFENPLNEDQLIQKRLKTLELLDSAIDSEAKKQLYLKELKISISQDLLKLFSLK